MKLQTEEDNKTARMFYEKLGFTLEDRFFHEELGVYFVRYKKMFA
jgi:ribosomal protein S18 acetylase RimI-like enzyme